MLLAAPAAAKAAGSAVSFGGETLSLAPGNIPAAEKAAAVPAQPAAAVLPLPQPRKKYTIALFMNGKNNLGTFMARKLMELEEVGSDENINIVAEIGLVQPKPACSTCAVANMYGAAWEGTRRFYVVRNPDPKHTKIASSLRLAAPDNLDMGDYKNLVSFVTWTKANFPAEKYIVVIGNHGGAWVDRKKKAPAPQKGVSYDDVTSNYITTPEIGAALREFGGADVLIFDDCLMQAAEVASEVGTQASFLLGSEEISYTSHFKPARLFAPLKADPGMTPAAFVSVFMQTFSAYNGAFWNAYKKYPGTFSVIDTARTAGLEELVKNYARAALAVGGAQARLAFRQAMKDVIRYHYKYCADLYNFVQLAQQNMAAKITEGKIPESDQTRALDSAAGDLRRYISNELVPYNFAIGSADGTEYARSHGVSVYIPAITASTADNLATAAFIAAPPTLKTKYTDLAFDKATGWSAFVNYLTAK
ncbi:MAG: clostripain-related cysteine peptidase [Elusimicrobia bacterium]|nr:clostripain-related cysteine peptidase [Elusimicrobiota bacterium]